MTLQSSGAISLANIQTEFGGSNPIALSEYYGAASGIPTSGTISLSQFYGASAAVNVLGYGGSFISGTSNTATVTVTAPAGTKSIVVTSARNTTSYRRTDIVSCTVGGTTANLAYSQEILTGSNGFNTSCTIHNVNKTYTSATSISITVQWAQINNSFYGSMIRVAFLDKAFSSYSYSSAGGNTAGNASWTSYSGGMSAACGVGREPTPFTTTLSGNAFNHIGSDPVYHSSFEGNGTSGTESITVGNPNDYYSLNVSAGCSWSPSKFS